MASENGISEGEFTRAVALLRDDIRTGFGTVTGRLDALNGKTSRHGEEIAKLQVKVDGVEDRIEGIESRLDTQPEGARISRKAMAGYSSAAATGAVAIVEIVKAIASALKG